MFYQTIIFDFDGVLCHDYFYSNLKQIHPKVSKFIEVNVFGKNSEIPNKWMRAELTMDAVNQYISKNTGIDFNELTKLFIESVQLMRVDRRLLDIAQKLIENNKSVALVTNNMDIFNIVTIKNHNLNNIFPVIINSFDYGIMKHESDGKLFDLAFEKLGVNPYKKALLIDDSSKVRKTFENRGGKTFPYENYDQFELWMKENLL